MKMKLLSIFILSALVFVSCDDYTEIDAPVKNATSGNANFSRFYSIGNSITAGYQSGTIYQSGQMYSYGNLIAKQVGTTYEIPYVSDPGLGGRMEVASVSPSFSIYTNPNKGTPLNSNYPLPYNNLGVPGALLYDILYAKSSTTCASYVFSNTPNPYFDFILRGKGQTELEQALSQAPTFLTIWIGNNDVLGYATSGGTSPAAPTNTTQFGQLFGGIAQGLIQFKTQANANFGVAIGNIPNVSAIPFFTTVGPGMAGGVKWYQLLLSGVQGLVYQSSTTGIGLADSSSLRNGTVLLTLKGSKYASSTYLGKPGGQFYRDFGIPVPTTVDTTKPFGFTPQNPWPNALILDPSEIAIANTAVTDFNVKISETVALLNTQTIPSCLVNINSAFNEFIAGKIVNGINFKTTYVSGGLFSLDGVHPSNQAHGIIANEFINAINTKFGAHIPLVDVSSIPGSLYFMSKVSYKQGYPIIPIEAFDHLLF
jgi:lysophospholipase L1-like esterase